MDRNVKTEVQETQGSQTPQMPQEATGIQKPGQPVKTNPSPFNTEKIIEGLGTIYKGFSTMFDGLSDQMDLIRQAVESEKAGLPRQAVNQMAEQTREVSKTTAANCGESTESLTTESLATKSLTAELPVIEEIAAAATPAVSEESAVSSEPSGPSEPSVSVSSVSVPAASAPAITLDELTKVLVAKIKQDRKANGKIQKLLAAYGVKQLSDLPGEKYEAFLNDVSQL